MFLSEDPSVVREALFLPGVGDSGSCWGLLPSETLHCSSKGFLKDTPRGPAALAGSN